MQFFDESRMLLFFALMGIATIVFLFKQRISLIENK